MLKRISHIKNVGTFQNCQARRVEFSKITLIYGRNTYGKSTLGDIFSSLQKNNPSGVRSRASIPGIEHGQLVDMAFAFSGENENDGKALFRNGQWEKPLTSSHFLQVYDDAFFHEHVFVARKFTRDTKANFSDFILGSQGVAVARNIEEKKKEKRAKTTRKKVLEREVLNGIDNIEEFVASAPPDSIEELVTLRDELREKHAALTKQIRDAASIHNRSNFSTLNFNPQVAQASSELNLLLQTSINTQHQSAKEKLDAHIQNHFAKQDGADKWIRAGLSYTDNENCAFCGQSFSESARALLDAYQECFNEEYHRHEKYVNAQIDRYLPMLSVELPLASHSAIRQNDLVFQAYPELADDAQYQSLKADYEQLKREVLERSASLEKPLVNIKEKFGLALAEKRSDPHRAIGTINIEELLLEVDALVRVVNSLNVTIKDLNSRINQFKTSVNSGDIEKRQQEITESGKGVSRRILRFEKKDACDELKKVYEEIAKLDTEIPEFEESLRRDQSEYLNRFYKRIDSYFKALGSHEFKLDKGLDKSGHRPLYVLKVKFRKKEINESELEKVFSESDRRALGLSVFLSGLDAISDDDLAKTVIVFDDPVTSFDDHRVTQTHSEMIRLSRRCEQIVLLSHFKEGIAQFLRTHAFGNNNIKLIEIEKGPDSSCLKVGDIDHFLLDIHDECRENIIDFMDRRVHLLKYKPRVFLEAEISYRFGKQIREHNITNSSLKDRIDGLLGNGVISEQVYQELDQWRDTLNPEHHVFPGTDIEDQRNTARQFMGFIFHKLIPKG